MCESKILCWTYEVSCSACLYACLCELLRAQYRERKFNLRKPPGTDFFLTRFIWHVDSLNILPLEVIYFVLSIYVWIHLYKCVPWRLRQCKVIGTLAGCINLHSLQRTEFICYFSKVIFENALAGCLETQCMYLGGYLCILSVDIHLVSGPFSWGITRSDR
jgi:hypothetical protein